MTKILLALVLLVGLPTTSPAAGLQLSIQEGRVSIDAQDVTVRQILSEWARVGKTRIVNAERVSGGPITIKFEGVPEKQALDIVLRNVPGYMASPRETRIANASVYETIMIMPTTTAVAAVRAPGAPFGGPQGRRAPFSVTQLQPASPPPAVFPEPEEDPAADQMDDPAIAAAAAAGLVVVPAPLPGGGPAPSGPIAAPGLQPPAAAGSRPSTSNPWNAPVGTAQPSLAPPPAPTPAQPEPTQRPRPPQADR